MPPQLPVAGPLPALGYEPAIRHALELLAAEGRLYPGESPELAPALDHARAHGLARIQGGQRRRDGSPRPYRITERGHLWLARPWRLSPSIRVRDLMAIRRDTIAALVAAGEPLTAEVADALGISPRRARQIRSDIHRAARRMSEE
jgi:DNA-binding PadR family transcriptional regulator